MLLDANISLCSADVESRCPGYGKAAVRKVGFQTEGSTLEAHCPTWKRAVVARHLRIPEKAVGMFVAKAARSRLCCCCCVVVVVVVVVVVCCCVEDRSCGAKEWVGSVV